MVSRGRLGSELRELVEQGAVELVTGFSTTALEVADGTVSVRDDDRRLTGFSTVVAATGFRPDLSLLSELRLELDLGLEAPRALGPLVDAAWHSCSTVPPHGHRELAHPEPELYVVGMKSYGRAPTFLVPTGNEHRDYPGWHMVWARAVVNTWFRRDRAQALLVLTVVGAGRCCSPRDERRRDRRSRPAPSSPRDITHG